MKNKITVHSKPLTGCYSLIAGLVLIAAVTFSVLVIWPTAIDVLAARRCSGPVKRYGKSVTCRDRETGRDTTLGEIQLLACCPSAAVPLFALGISVIGARIVRKIEFGWQRSRGA